MNQDKALLVALDRFYNVQEIRYFRDWLRKQRDSEMARAIKTDGNPDVARGRAQALMELVEIIDGAPDALKRLEQRNVKERTQSG
jgi:hypothetical protein